MDIAFVLYHHMTALDLVGPYEVLARQPGVTPHFVAATRDAVPCDAGLTLLPTATFDRLDHADIVVVPGSARPFAPLRDERLIGWLRAVYPTTTWAASVCTGATLLAAAGILQGRVATTHWAFRQVLASYGVDVSAERIVVDGDVITAAGVSAGIDMALRLVALLWGDEAAMVAQLIIEYDPQPPFDAGAPHKVSPELLRRATDTLAAAADPATADRTPP